jgi:voltage-gated potassium channel
MVNDGGILRRRLLLLASGLAILLTIGASGYILIDGYPPFEAFYMALTTATTVGYAEIRPLSTAGRIFNAFYLAISVSTVFLYIGVITQTILELELTDVFAKRRQKKMIDQLNDHYIVCGFGRVGRGAAAEMKDAGVKYLIVDRDADRVHCAMRAGMQAVQADCTQDDTLREAGVGRARGLVTALATDADNLYVILSAKAMNPNLHIATRINEEEAEVKLRRAGADVVFAPYSTAGHRLAQSLLRPHVYEFLDFTTQSIGLDVRIEQVQVSAQSALVSKMLRETQIRRDLGVIVLAIRKPGGRMSFNPSAETVVDAGDSLIVMGPPDRLAQLERLVTEAQE